LSLRLVGRSSDKLAAVAAVIEAEGGVAHAVPGDATSRDIVKAAFAHARAEGPVAAAVFNAGGNVPRSYLETDPDFLEQMWRVGAYAGHLFALEALEVMLPEARGTLLFTGASASLRGKAGFAAFASAKAALRALAQSLAREFGPQGLHVAHVIIDGGIDGDRLNRARPEWREARGPDGMLGLDAIAETYWQLHAQHRSAWTHEIDLRPWVESF
jgi:NAD(P)-dependent dehydrogenase (short-subunit alcohol dehydrogenase family)